MAKLTAKARKALPAEKFAGPGRSFPLTDKVHDRMAISGATRSEHAGNISASTAEHIKAAARAKLGKSKDGPAKKGYGDNPGHTPKDAAKTMAPPPLSWNC